MSLEELCVELIEQWRMSLEDGHVYSVVINSRGDKPRVQSSGMVTKPKSDLAVIDEAVLLGLNDWPDKGIYSITISNKGIFSENFV